MAKLPPEISGGSLGAMMDAQSAANQPPPQGGDSDDGGPITCPSCGAQFPIQKQTTYQAGPVTAPPPSAGGGMGGGSASGSMPPSGAGGM